MTMGGISRFPDLNAARVLLFGGNFFTSELPVIKIKLISLYFFID